MAQSAVVGFGEERTRGDDVEGSRDIVSWRRAHEELVRLAATRAGLDCEEGRWLLRALRAGAHARLGYGSFREYTARLFGYSPRLTQEKIRVAEALEGLPELSRELQHGSVSFSAARELTRVATAATEGKWLEAARGRAIREVEELVSGHRPGSLPDIEPFIGATLSRKERPQLVSPSYMLTARRTAVRRRHAAPSFVRRLSAL